MEELVKLGEAKSYSRAININAVMDMISSVKEEDVVSVLWPWMKERIDDGWKGCTVERFLYLLAFRRRCKKVKIFNTLKRLEKRMDEREN